MTIIKTIKFDLPIDGVKVKTIEELREHFTVEILSLYENGILIKWLQSRNHADKINFIKKLQAYSSNRFMLMKKLCELFEVETDDLLIAIAVGESPKKSERNFAEIKKKYLASIKPDEKIKKDNHNIKNSTFIEDDIVNSKFEENHYYMDTIKAIVFKKFGKKPDDININLRKGLGANNLDIFDIIVALEEEFDIEIDEDLESIIDSIETMQDLIDTVKSHIA